MFTRIVIEGFKSFRKVDLRLGGLNLLVGANGSGKSNFLDALRVLQGIGNGYTIGEILDGKPKSATNESWDGIRGGSARACFDGDDAKPTFAIQVAGLIFDEDVKHAWVYRVHIEPRRGHIVLEALWLNDEEIYRTRPAEGEPILSVESSDFEKPLLAEKSRPVLVELQRRPEAWKLHDVVRDVAHQLANMQRIDPAPSILRDYSHAFAPERIGERGENLAALVEMFDADDRSAYVDWLRELRPQEVEDVTTVRGALDEPMFAIVERGRKFPAPVLSDGTLRFAAIAAAFYQSGMPEVMTIEEIEKGLHPSRVRVMVEMLRANGGGNYTQIMATTHSPTVVAWLEPDEHKTTFVVARDPDTGESTVTRLVDIEDFERIVADQQLADLFAEGWMESAL